MKMRKIIITEPGKSIGIRMVKSACTPEIVGLFLQNENFEWTAKEISLSGESQYSFIPVRLVGNSCDLPVTWHTDWQPSGYDGYSSYPSYSSYPPIFFGSGQVGVVGYEMTYSSPGKFNISVQAGILNIWATVAGQEYGPVKITCT